MRTLLTLLCFLSSVAAAETPHARRLELPGFTDQTKQEIYKKIPSLKSGQWTQDDLDQLIQYLVLNEQYDSVAVSKESEETYKLNVGRVRRIASLGFSGNASVSESELRRETGLGEKIAFDPGALVEAGEKIRTFYEAMGFPKTQVDIKYTESKETQVAVNVIVHEGPQTMIEDFRVQTPNADLEILLRRVLRKFRNEPFTNRTLAEIRIRARESLSAGGFWRTELPEPKVQLNFEESKAVLVFAIDKSDQYFFNPQGNSKLTKSSISSSLGLDTYFSSNPNIAGELASKVRAYYLSQGFARVEVQAEEVEGSKPLTRKVSMKIGEGPLVEIDRFELSGSYSQPAETYIKFLKKHSTEQIADDHYVKEDLDQALKNMVTDRWNEGFLRAKLISTRTIYNRDRDRVSVLINFDEGPLTQIQKITFEGNQHITEGELLAVVGLEAGKPLRLFALDEAVLKVKQFYRDRGFLEMTLQSEKEGLVTYNEDNTLVHLNFKIAEGPQVHVNSILLEGNNITRDEVILKELEFKKGDILTPQAIEESTSRLQRLGHFASIEIRTLEERTQIAERTVIVKLVDRDPGLFNFGVGVTNERGFTVRGYTGVAYRNIAGTGRGVSARIDGNYNVNDLRYLERKITLGYLEPYIFNTRTRGRLNLSRSVAVSDYDAQKASEVNQTTWSLEQDITSHLLVVWDVLSVATVRDFYIKSNSEITQINIGSTALTMDLDYRDHPFNPTKGTFTRLNTEYGAPGLFSSDTIEYSRSYASFTSYLPIKGTTNWVWANSLRGGYLRNLSRRDDGGVPYDKKGFLLGGQSTIRGFTPDEAFPNKVEFGSDIFNLKTSATMELFKSEVRFPIWGNIGGALFYDGGEVKVKAQAQEQDLALGWRDSFGIAARYVTPVGAVSLEYGWKIRPRASRNESPSVFHFSIGTF